MCGIAGTFIRRGEARPDEAAVAAMRDALRHRGPDGASSFVDGRAAFGFRRLAILDLSPAGEQPYRTDDGAIVAMTNGEIYNHRELRADLERDGVRLRSWNDAEVVPHLYARHGDAFLERLRGMFAIALLDRPRRRLLLARDRVGKKPLYYRAEGDVIDFASEAKALVAARGARGHDAAAIVRYLTFGVVPGERSAHAGLARVPAGGRVTFDEEGVDVARWWTPPALEPDDGSAAEHADALFDALVAATRDRLDADVPLGMFLSGGIDSGLVLAAARAAGAAELPTFTVGFADPSLDERAAAARTAAHFGVTNTALEAQPRPAEVVAEVARTFDEPFGDSSAVPTMVLARLARRHVVVALGGDGGDDLFAGYRRHRAVRVVERARALRPLAKVLAGGAGETANGTAGRGAWGQFRRFVTALALEPDEATLYWTTLFRAPLRARFLALELLEAAGGVDPEHEALDAMRASRGGALDRALARDFGSYLPDDLLVKVDAASMAHGLEVRSPFLDPRVIDVAARLSVGERVGWCASKRLLRRAARERLPREVARGRKRGFGVPLAAWLRGPLSGQVDDLLLGERFAARAVLRRGAARELVARHRSGREDWSSYLWVLLALEAWFRRYLDGDAS